ncbi:MAG: FAD binding domain-containing protein [Pseudomonadota bacterium]
MMITFILNNKKISTDLPSGMVTLDFIRRSERLVGTKESCREGDCGACLILVGEWDGKAVSYQSINSCLLPLAELHGKHVVTIEGLNNHGLSPIQQAIVDEGATQCGYCTPGIVISLTSFFCNQSHFDENQAIAALDGNICRCTGYQAIKRAASQLCRKLNSSVLSDTKKNHLKWLVDAQILPHYFLQIPEQLHKLSLANNEVATKNASEAIIVAGGTDLWVQKPTELYNANLMILSQRKDLKGIRIKQNSYYIGATTSIEEIKKSHIIHKFFPKINDYFKRIASTPIRHRATLGGNIVNASPIGDLTVFFLALETSITITDFPNKRKLALKDFFKAYKQVDKHNNELVEEISFPLPTQKTFFNFEKVSKRTHLDIASVNSAIQIVIDNDMIQQVHLSAGGVAPIPLYLSRTVNYLRGKKIHIDSIREATSIAQSEISPISDVRGSADYKRLLLRQLIYAHFITLFPERFNEGEVLR